MRELEGRAFWVRIDALLAQKGLSLADFCAKIGASYNTVSYQRVRKALPKIEQLVAMADVLQMPIEALLGFQTQTDLSLEAKAVQEDPELRLLVRAVMRDRRLLSALAAVVESGERSMGSFSAE